MAGLPPFIGFSAKMVLISSLYLDEDYYLFYLFCIVSLIISFFYLQNVRFYGKLTKKIFFFKNNSIALLNLSYIITIMVLTSLSLINPIFLAELVNFSSFFVFLK